MGEVSLRVAEQLRATIEDFFAYEHTDDALTEALDGLAALRALLAGPEAPRYYERANIADVMASDDMEEGFRNASPFGGRSPVSPYVEFTHHPDPSAPRVTTLVTVRRPFEGPARSVHGGVVAGLFDQFLGSAQRSWMLAHDKQMVAATIELTVRYHAPTPLDTELRFEAFYEDVDDKYATGRATCHARDVLTAEATGRFRKLDPARFFSTDKGGFTAKTQDAAAS